MTIDDLEEAPPSSRGADERPGQESGTAPGDRSFRPDIEGLRAVAVALVVLYHANLPGLTGGFVGVDVFFVISGFLITGLLLRERQRSRRTSLAHFYSRRVRRILPGATVVILVTVAATYVVLGPLSGDPTAVMARWTALFLANIHLAALGTDYLSAHQPPSPLQNFWSLAVEEQFYLVFPALVILAGWRSSAERFRARLGFVLLVVAAASLLIGVVQTSQSPTWAYFSPLPRAWELAAGALVALATSRLRTLTAGVASAMAWIGLSAIVVAALAYTDATPYPGIAVVLPVVGTVLVIAGGTAEPRTGPEWLLRRRGFQWTGRLSYSLYLWHWPILVLAAEAAGQTSLPFRSNLGWLALAVAAAVASYTLVEQPVRHARPLIGHHWRTAFLGLALVAITLVGATVALQWNQAPNTQSSSLSNAVSVPQPQLDQLLAAAPKITSLPPDLLPSLAQVHNDWGGPPTSCSPSFGATGEPACIFGDPHGSRTMVITGDSHAWMWFQALNLIGILSHWRVVILGKGTCPFAALPFVNPLGFGSPGGRFTQCDAFRRFVHDRIVTLRPDLVIVSENADLGPGNRRYTTQQWKDAVERAITGLPVRPNQVVIIGNVPQFPGAGPQCLALHPNDVQFCSGHNSAYVVAHNQAEQQAADSIGATYVDTVPWFCTHICTDVVGRLLPYWYSYHITRAYSIAVSSELSTALDLGRRSTPSTAP